MTVFGWLASQTVKAKDCLIHEKLVPHKKNVLGIFHKTNFTIVKVHNCPIYTHCCHANSACCFDYSWFWTTLAIILILAFLALVIYLYSWYMQKHRKDGARARDIPAGAPAFCSPSGLGNTPGAAPAEAALMPRVAGQPRCTKPPAFDTVSVVSAPQPGATHPPGAYREAPPPYSPASRVAESENCDPVCTQTNIV